MTRKKKSLFNFLTQVFFASLMCASMSFFSSCSKKNDKNLPVLKFTKSINPSPVINIVDLDGIAIKNGLKPIIELSNDLESVITGKNDAKLNDLIPPLISAASGADLVIYAGSMTGGHILYANKNVAEELKDLKNWKGHTIGMYQGNTGYFLVPNILKRLYGYTDEDVEIKLLMDFDAQVAACAKGEVDLTNLSYSGRDTADSYGLVKIAELVDLAPDYACCRQTANGQRFREDRNLFVLWTKSLIEAWKIFKTDEEHSIEVMMKQTGESRNWVYEHYYDANFNAHTSMHPDPNYNGVCIQYETCVEQGFVENPRPLEDFFDISVYAEALRLVIDENPGDSFYTDMWTYFVNHNNKYPNFSKLYPNVY